MATIHTLIDYDRQNPTAISREQYTDVGADAFAPGTFPRAFNDLEVWDAATDGNQLVLDTDYELVDVDYELSGTNYENEAVYKTLRVINATYQTGNIWLTYSAIGTYPTADLHDPSALPAAGALAGTEPIATVQSGEHVKMTPAQIETFGAGVRETITVKAGSYTILDDNLNIYEDTTGAGDDTFDLPTLADNLGRVIELHKVDDGAGVLILDGEGAETIDGNLTIQLPSQYNYIKVRAGTATWHVLELKANYDTGWVANNDWTDVTLTVTHNLNAPLGDLIVKFLVSSDSGGAFPIEIVDFARLVDATPGANTSDGISFVGVDNDGIEIQTPVTGLIVIERTGPVLRLATQAWYYHAKVYRLN